MIFIVSIMLFCAVSLIVMLYMLGYVLRFNDSVTLPNGMILRREYVFWMDERDDMYASDGRTLVARNVDVVCFNDRYVHVFARRPGYGGLFDGETGRAVPSEAFYETYAATGLSGGHSCNGYYTGFVGPGLLYDGMTFPFLPPCAWRNLDNPTLMDRSWFERPCDDG